MRKEALAIKANNASASAAVDPVALVHSSIMTRNGSVFLAALAAQAPSQSRLAISVRNMTAISAAVVDRTPTATPSARPSASSAESKASGGDDSTAVVIIVVVVVGVVVLLAVLGAGFRADWQ